MLENNKTTSVDILADKLLDLFVHNFIKTELDTLASKRSNINKEEDESNE